MPFLKHAKFATVNQPAKHHFFFHFVRLLLVLIEITRDNLLSLNANVLSVFKKCRVKLFAIAHRLFPQVLEMHLISEIIELSVTFHFLLYSFQTKKCGLVLIKISVIHSYPRTSLQIQNTKIFKN